MFLFTPRPQTPLHNLVSIEPEDPEAEREGPISLKVQVPFGVHNAYLNVVADDITDPAYIVPWSL